MEANVDQVLQLFGISLASYAAVAALTGTVVQFVKTKLGANIIFGYRTDILAFVTAFACSLYSLGNPGPDPVGWLRVVVLAFVGWLGPSAVHSALKEASERI